MMSHPKPSTHNPMPIIEEAIGALKLMQVHFDHPTTISRLWKRKGRLDEAMFTRHKRRLVTTSTDGDEGGMFSFRMAGT